MTDNNAEDLAAERLLAAAGWRAGMLDVHKADSWAQGLEPCGFRMFPAARSALAEFGGLKASARGPGINWQRSSFNLDPMLAKGEADRFSEYEKVIGSRLFPLGESAGGAMFMAIDECGNVYLLMEDIIALGGPVLRALIDLLVGRNRGFAVSATTATANS